MLCDAPKPLFVFEYRTPHPACVLLTHLQLSALIITELWDFNLKCEDLIYSSIIWVKIPVYLLLKIGQRFSTF